MAVAKTLQFSDAARLLSLYQLWLDDLFPKAKFVDALAMVEKAGHKGRVRAARLAWIDEDKPRASREDDDDDDPFREPEEAREPAIFPARAAPIFPGGGAGARSSGTPAPLGVDDDLYDATPRPTRTADVQPDSAPSGAGAGGEPDGDELDALLAEDEARRAAAPSSARLGNGSPTGQPPHAADPAERVPGRNRPPAEDDADDLDALIAEAEAAQSRVGPPVGPMTGARAPVPAEQAADADAEEAMAEMDGLW